MRAVGDERKEDLKQAEQKLAEFAEGVAQTVGLTADHYVQASSPFLRLAPKTCLRIAESGLRRFPTSRFLCDHVGGARLVIAAGLRPGSAQVAELTAAEQAFRKALAQEPDTFHAHVGIMQVLSRLDRVPEALAELDLVAKDHDAELEVPDSWLLRAGLLMRCGRAAEAVPLLTGDGATGDLRPAARILLLRAHALAGDAAAATALIAELQKEAPGTRTLVEAADALAFLGKKPEALQLLAQRPKAGEWKTEEERIDQLLAASAAAMEAFWKATDFSPKGPLRAALTKALDHHFLVMDPAAKPQPKNTEVGAAPVLMARLLASAPASPQKDWGNRVLLALCLRAAPGYKPTPFEAKVVEMTKAMSTPTEADLPGVFLAMRHDVGDPDAAGVLTGLRALEKLDPKPAPKGGKPDQKQPVPPKK
ncbi:MAG: hypothetical protein FJ265_06860 [Planctomycetes bacterium]|nr:hypothetical protein [Planctomycetota bacterium]